MKLLFRGLYLFGLSVFSFFYGGAGLHAQIVVTPNQTANAMAQKLVGAGVTAFNAVLNCGPNSHGIFTATNSTLNTFGLDSGIVLTTGNAAGNGFDIGIGAPAGQFASGTTGTGGDPDLNAIPPAAITTEGCYLTFDFIPIGDSIKFDYVFGSEEYPTFTCSSFNDRFGFFIKPVSSGTFTNVALIPNSTIPVSINTINQNANGCSNNAPGSGIYYLNNAASTTLVYNGVVRNPNNGFPKGLTALAAVIPCDTYRLKLAIADVGDQSYDSGVFLKAGSLVATNISVSSVGGAINTGADTPQVVRNCLSGQFNINLGSASTDTLVVKYLIGGNATNGVDYETIADSVVILPGNTQYNIFIHPLTTVPASPDSEYVTISILSPYLCGNGQPAILGTATIMIRNQLPAVAYASRDSVCPGGASTLNVSIGQLACGLANTTCQGGLPTAYFLGTDANTGDNPSPYNITTASSGDRLQFLYRKDELVAAGVSPGFINSIGFNISEKNSTDTLKDFSMRMACTSDPQLSGNSFKNFSNIAQVVPATDVVTTLGWNTYDFPVPYYWDGTSNLVVEFCWKKTGGAAAGSADKVYYSPTSFTSTMFMPGGLVTPNTLLNPCNSNDESGVNSRNNNRPNTRFNVCANNTFTYQWTPNTFLNSSNTPSPVASNITGNSITYGVTVTNNQLPNCISTASVTIGVDNSNSVDATPQSPAIVCFPGDLQLGAMGMGASPVSNLACGTANTQNCTNPDSITLGNNPVPADVMTNTPFNNNRAYSEYQFFIPKRELLAGGMFSGTIRSLSFLNKSLNMQDEPIQNYRISLKCTTRDSFQINASDADFETGATLVYTNAAQTLTPNSWNKFVFDQPYNWDTTQNLLVQICVGNQTTPDTPGLTPVAMTQGTSLMKFSNTGNVCDVNNNIPVNRYNQRPVVRFDYCPAPAAPFSYSWTPGAGLTDSTIQNPVAAVTESTTYTVTTRGRNGCRVSDSVRILVPSHDYHITPEDTAICLGNRIPYYVTGDGIVSATWYQNGYQPAQWLSCNPCTDPVAMPQAAVTYEVIINDALNCPDTLTANVSVRPNPNIHILNNDTTIRYGDHVTLMVDGGIEYSWYPVGTLSDPRIPNPVASPTDPTQYVVIGLNEYGCSASDTVFIDIDYRDNLLVPSAFTPNGDGLNDVFHVVGFTNQRLMEFRIFNRWGREIFSTTDPNSGWDGTWKGVPQDMGVYKYLIRLAFPDGYAETYKGDVTLIR